MVEVCYQLQSRCIGRMGLSSSLCLLKTLLLQGRATFSCWFEEFQRHIETVADSLRPQRACLPPASPAGDVGNLHADYMAYAASACRGKLELAVFTKCSKQQ